MELHDEVADAILDLMLYADQRADLAPEIRLYVDRLRELRERINEGEWMDVLFETDGEPE